MFDLNYAIWIPNKLLKKDPKLAIQNHKLKKDSMKYRKLIEINNEQNITHKLQLLLEECFVSATPVATVMLLHMTAHDKSKFKPDD